MEENSGGGDGGIESFGWGGRKGSLRRPRGVAPPRRKGRRRRDERRGGHGAVGRRESRGGGCRWRRNPTRCRTRGRDCGCARDKRSCGLIRDASLRPFAIRTRLWWRGRGERRRA